MIDRMPRWFGFSLWLLGALLLVLPSAPMVSAHEGHAGKNLVFLQNKLALKQMLPQGAKLSRRKQVLDDAGAQWATANLGVTPAQQLYTFFLARDEAGAVIGSAIVVQRPYRHGVVSLGVGVDAAGQVTRAGVLGIHSKYLPELMRSVGKGWIAALSGFSPRAIAARGQAAAKDDLAGHEIPQHLADLAAVLATFQHQMRP